MKGWDLGWYYGTLNTDISYSFMSFRWVLASKLASKEMTGLEPFRQFPVIFNSSVVWMFSTLNLVEGPSVERPIQRYKSLFLRVSKKIKFLAVCASHNS